jgi:hypothetical protein
MAGMRILFRTLALAALVTAPVLVAQAPTMDHGVVATGYKVLASPAMSITMHAPGGKSVNLYYNAPSARGRVVMGKVVPYGEVWRTGANPATTLVSNAPLKIGALSVPAGVHTLYTLPAEPGKPWLLIVNNEIAQWGTVYKPEMDLGRTPMMSSPVSSTQDLMSITFEGQKGNIAQLHIKWAGVDEWVPVTVE